MEPASQPPKSFSNSSKPPLPCSLRTPIVMWKNIQVTVQSFCRNNSATRSHLFSPEKRAFAVLWKCNGIPINEMSLTSIIVVMCVYVYVYVCEKEKGRKFACVCVTACARLLWEFMKACRLQTTTSQAAPLTSCSLACCTRGDQYDLTSTTHSFET